MCTHAYIKNQGVVTTDNPAYHSAIPGSSKTTNSKPLYAIESIAAQGNQGTSDHLETCCNKVIMTANEAYIVKEPQQGKCCETNEILAETDTLYNNNV